MNPMLRHHLILGVLLCCAVGCATTPKPAITPDAKGHIPWEQAKWLIQHGDVKSISQKDSRKVYVFMDDWTTYSTEEPTLDDVLPLIRARARFGRHIPLMVE